MKLCEKVDAATVQSFIGIFENLIAIIMTDLGFYWLWNTLK